MMIKELRSKRFAAEVPAILLAAKATVNHSRLSNLQCGYAQPTEEESLRLTSAIEQLSDAKADVQKAAAVVGWPLGEVR
jgi:hypothetical protein